MASNNRKGLDKILVGSQTLKVLALTDKPVLVYR
jgi:nucleotide-binding universal stress UspA family protein